MTMTNRRRGILIGSLLALGITASLAVAVAAYIQRLPDPDTADRRGLFRWLIECDLREQPPELQLIILRRVEAELRAGIDFRKIAAKLDETQRQRLLANADFLARRWFTRAVDRYFAEPAERRDLILAEQIEQIQSLGIMDQLSALEHGLAAGGQDFEAASKTATDHSIASMAMQTKRIQTWLADSEPHERRRMALYFTALGDRLLIDGLRKYLPTW
jgi:hypothetical protein